ncbi:titin [Gracilaria domingensis]|nr:titin [Gracilaria domingensis]
MIRNNKLYYSAVEVPWYSFEISRTSLGSFVASVLITLISYQTAAILFDVVLGLEKRHQAPLKDWLTRLYYGGDIPEHTAISRDPERVKAKTVLVILLLLTATPLIDIVLLALALSRTQALDLDQAGFGAVRFGVADPADALETTPYLSLCRTVSFEERPNDVLQASFRLCESPILPEDEAQNVTGVEITMGQDYSVTTRVIFQGLVMLGVKWARLQAEEGDFWVRGDLTENSSALLVQTALEQFSEYCGETNVLGPVPAKRNEQFGSEKRLVESVGIACDNASTTPDLKNQITTNITIALRQRMTLVSSDQLLLRSESDLSSNFSEQRDIVLLKRTEKNASLFALIVAALLLLLVRVIVRTTLASDVEEGLHKFIRDQLPVPRQTSLLRAGEEKLSFRVKYQVGELGYYGVAQEGLPETDIFEGGVPERVISRESNLELKTEANDERLRRSQRRADANEWNNIMNIVRKNEHASKKLHDVKSLVMGGSLRVEEIVMQRTPTKTKMWKNGVVSVDRTTLARGVPAVYLTHGELISEREAAEKEAAKEEEDKQKRKEEKAAERETKKVQTEQRKKEREVAAQKRKLQREEERQQKCLERERKRAATAQKRAAREEERKYKQSEKNEKRRKANHFQSSKPLVSLMCLLVCSPRRSLAQRLGLSEKKCLSSEDDSELEESAYILMKMHSVDADWLLSHKVQPEVSVGDQMCMEEPGWRGWKMLEKDSGVQLSPARKGNAGVMSEEEI